MWDILLDSVFCFFINLSNSVVGLVERYSLLKFEITFEMCAMCSSCSFFCVHRVFVIEVGSSCMIVCKSWIENLSKVFQRFSGIHGLGFLMT
ncbi:hypothetical protein GDO78_001458 [Eleutherodactylus coqui]|uniref:Uncharacterized protein n=1 Tax=Eleutherodactylus coqui TaxID=57060 RepID=A0A8J6FSZ8_ELECQ|nr:hypothetical protein GDO78_001458 [Eleutherodactylus coqui]